RPGGGRDGPLGRLLAVHRLPPTARPPGGLHVMEKERRMTVPTEAPWAVEVRRNVRIPMPDGVTLAADLYLPQGADGRTFPAIIEYTPYHKTNNAAYGPRASRYPYFASPGYGFVNVHIRAPGDSAGFHP